MVKTIGMMRIISEAYSGIRMLLMHSASTENPLSWNEISTAMKNELSRLSRMKECEPRQEEQNIRNFFDDLSNAFKLKVSELEDKI